MKQIPNAKYTKEFRVEAVRLVTEQGLSAGEAANRLMIPKSTLENWVRAFKAGKLDKVGASQRPLTTDVLKEYRSILERYGMKASMSAKGNCYDNAPMENFWSTLKRELVFQRRFSTRQQAVQEITEFIEVFYYRQRIQKGLGCLSPAAFERRYYESKMAA